MESTVDDKTSHNFFENHSFIKKYLFHIIIVSIVVIATIGWVANYMFKQNSPKSKAAENTLYIEHFDNLNDWAKGGVTADIHINTGGDRVYPGDPPTSLFIKRQQTGNTESFVTHTFGSPRTSEKPNVYMYDPATGVGGAVTQYNYLKVSNGTDTASVGWKTHLPNYEYCPTDDASNCLDTGIHRSRGWHRFIFFVTPKGTFAKIDNHTLSELPGMQTSAGFMPSINPKIVSYNKIILGLKGTNPVGNNDYPSLYIDYLQVFPIPTTPSLAVMINNYRQIYLNSYADFNSAADLNRLFRLIWNGEGTETDAQKAQKATLVSNLRQTRSYLQEIGQSTKASIICSELNAKEYSCDNVATNRVVTNYQYFIPQPNWWCHQPPPPGYDTDWTVMGVPLPYSEYIGNSSGEEESFAARDIGKYYFDHYNTLLPAQRNDLLLQLRLFSFHSITKGEATPLYPAFTSRTVYDNFDLDNHFYHPNPTYGLVTVLDLVQNDYLYRSKFHQPAPPEFQHNVLKLYNQMLSYVDMNTFQYKGDQITMRSRDKNNNNVSDMGTTPYNYDPTCNEPYTPSHFTHDGSIDQANQFTLTGRDDWGVDALMNRMRMYALMKDVYGSAANYQGIDMVQHVQDFFYYIHDNYLWRWAQPLSQIQSIPIGPTTNIDDPLYRWMRNGQVLEDLKQFKNILDNPSIPSPSPTATPRLTPSPTATPTQTPITIRGWVENFGSSNANKCQHGIYNGENGALVKLYNGSPTPTLLAQVTTFLNPTEDPRYNGSYSFRSINTPPGTYYVCGVNNIPASRIFTNVKLDANDDVCNSTVTIDGNLCMKYTNISQTTNGRLIASAPTPTISLPSPTSAPTNTPQPLPQVSISCGAYNAQFDSFRPTVNWTPSILAQSVIVEDVLNQRRHLTATNVYPPQQVTLEVANGRTIRASVTISGANYTSQTLCTH